MHEHGCSGDDGAHEKNSYFHHTMKAFSSQLMENTVYYHFTLDFKVNKTYRYEDVEKVLQRGKLRDELLHHFTESLKD